MVSNGYEAFIPGGLRERCRTAARSSKTLRTRGKITASRRPWVWPNGVVPFVDVDLGHLGFGDFDAARIFRPINVTSTFVEDRNDPLRSPSQRVDINHRRVGSAIRLIGPGNRASRAYSAAGSAESSVAAMHHLTHNRPCGAIAFRLPVSICRTLQ